jgi:hypothetical protein
LGQIDLAPLALLPQFPNSFSERFADVVCHSHYRGGTLKSPFQLWLYFPHLLKWQIARRGNCPTEELYAKLRLTEAHTYHH